MQNKASNKRFYALCAWMVIGSVIMQPRPIYAQNNTIQKGLVSYYGCEACKYNKTKDCQTASGKSLYKLIRSKTLYAAAWGYPFGTRIKVTNPSNKHSITVIILDRGPAKRLSRIIDLAPYAFSQIADLKKGVIEAQIEVVP